MNKIVLTKTTSAIFLAFVLVVGTFALSSPSLIVGAAQATSDRDKDYDYEDDKKSYGKDRDSYDKSRDHTDDNNEYDSESTKYSEYIDKRYNSYDSEYGMDNDYKDRYGKDSYESQYSSYDKDNRYKSKDGSSNSINIKKVNCNNINLNVNGLELNLTSTPFLSGLLESEADEDGERGTGSYGSEERSYGNGQQPYSGKDFKFVCINNNNNTVVEEEEEPQPEPLTCEECFTTNLNQADLNEILDTLATFRSSLEILCETLSNTTFPSNEVKIVGLVTIFHATEQLSGEQISEEDYLEVLRCLEEIGLITLPPGFDEIPPPPPPLP